MREISQLIVRMAGDNPGRGYTRIQGALTNLSHKVGRGTIANVLKRNGIEPSPERSRRTPWSTFLKAHWKVLAASDFLTAEVWTGRGLVTHYVLFMISLADRVVHIAGITTQPDESWMLQIARNVTDAQSGALHGKRYLIIDRDTKYSQQFRRLVQDSGTNVIRLPPMSPNLNAYAERFVRSIKDECLDRMIFFGQASLRRAITDYMEHYHRERNHQGLENRLIQLPTAVTADHRSNPLPCSAWRNAELLLPRSCLTAVVPIFGQHDRRRAASKLPEGRPSGDRSVQCVNGSRLNPSSEKHDLFRISLIFASRSSRSA